MRPPRLTPSQTLALALALAAVAVAASCNKSAEGDRREEWRAELAAWKQPAALPSFPLVDDAGHPFNLGELKGEPLFLGFVFTRCPVADACPMTMARLKELERVAPSRRILVVTLDPAFDTPPVLAAYKQAHGVSFAMATGDREVIEALTSLFNVVALQRGGVDIAHPVKLALLDKELKPVREWHDNNFDPRQIAASDIYASTPQ